MTNEIKKETVGQAVVDIMNKGEDYGDAAIFEQGNERLKHLEPLFIEKLEVAKKEMPPDRDFYMDVHFLMPHIFQGLADHFKIIPRLTCPQPTFSQAVYLYHRTIDDVELVWTIPHIIGCVMIDENYLTLDPEQRQLANWVMEFKHGRLYRDTKRINLDLEKPKTARESLLLL